ncbi:MAG: trypsin-like peptidase domain-containing protein, partial [bacterium]|nr:trypsin-like peptidase domain-containing protein [bacterium]
FTYVDISISSGETLSGKVVGRDEQADLAVIKITADRTFSKVDFGDSTKTEQGDEVFALGFPFGIKGDVSFKEGTISRRIEGYFETSAEIHPGNSGGPLVNRYGQVIGINTAIYGKTISGLQLGETIKLAIPINTAKNLTDDLKAGRNIVVESQEEKQAKQEVVTRSTCLAQSETYYQNLVAQITQLTSNDSELQNLLSKLDREIESIKQSLSNDISRISSEYDGLIAQVRQSYEKRLQSIVVAGSRYRSVTEEAVANQTESVRAQMDEQISRYENQKQSSISSVQLSANSYISKYETLKTKARSDREISNSNMLKGAKDKKVEYYDSCVNQ